MAPSRHQGKPRVSTVRRLTAIGLGLAVAAVVVESAAFDYGRAGHFPHYAGDVLGPLPKLLHKAATPADQLASAPLAGFPLFEEGERQAKAGNAAGARALVREAVRRDPQLFEARLWLANDAVREGRYPEAVRQFDWLFAVGESARPAITPLMVALAKIPQAQPAFEAFAARKPIWLQGVADGMMQPGGDPAFVFRLLGGTSAREDASEVGKSGLVASLVARQQYDAAYLAWVSSLPQSALGAVGYVYDSNFRQLPGALPFNWNLSSSDMASVDFLKEGGVQISYYGDGTVHLLEQTLTLPRGRFKFVARSTNASDRDANHVAWSISCIGGTAATLGRVDIPVAPASQAHGVMFTVPANCPAQKLSLDGTPSEYPASADVQIKAVSITRSDGGR
ncbi:MAG: hypothetical protein WCS75_05740 [Sphingomonas sp.]|jgi:hypothetical protein|uniref:tetratricopeptide repeat protein n=1 Tax=Sphingomonas sp. TaxID=28214 RepID=UPI003565E6B7